VSIRGTLIGFGAILWLGAIVCWIRARGNWRLSREGWLFLALGIPFLVAGWFFTASSYPQEHAASQPTPAPAVVVTTPAPAPAPSAAVAPPPAAETYAAAVKDAQHAAVARYPALGKAGTEFNTRFVTAYRQLRASDPNYFSDPEWPLHLADEIARDLKER
jgi:hypothetical protein